ncbi:MAG: hypothetical protein L0H63_11555 [Nitrococcus sp.]|nr:hypothetical protein [Nitrococcus sp.]
MNTQNFPNARQSLPLPGLDGANPLGFLGALGLFRIVCRVREYEDAKMRWVGRHGTWIPCLDDSNLDSQLLLDLLDSQLVRNIQGHPIKILEALGSTDSGSHAALFREVSQDAAEASWLAALASSVTDATSVNNQLQTARRDYFFGNLSSVMARTTPAHIERTVFHPWDYSDPLDNQSLHFDPSEDRRHALQWNKPAGDPNRKVSGGMLGANRLAIEAIAWFTSLPDGENLHTLGFTGFNSRNTRWTWPIWAFPLAFNTVTSVLALRELQEENISTGSVQAMQYRGIAAAFRVARILVGKTPNFTPTQRVA